MTLSVMRMNLPPEDGLKGSPSPDPMTTGAIAYFQSPLLILLHRRELTVRNGTTATKVVDARERCLHGERNAVDRDIADDGSSHNYKLVSISIEKARETLTICAAAKTKRYIDCVCDGSEESVERVVVLRCECLIGELEDKCGLQECNDQRHSESDEDK